MIVVYQPALGWIEEAELPVPVVLRMLQDMPET